MAVKRIVANLAAEQPADIAEFYKQLFGLDAVMNHGWIVTLASDETNRAQLSIASEGGSGTDVPDLSIEVDDFDAVLGRAKSMGVPVEYGPVDEPWGVRRFHVRDPGGRLLNVLMHIERLVVTAPGVAEENGQAACGSAEHLSCVTIPAFILGANFPVVDAVLRSQCVDKPKSGKRAVSRISLSFCFRALVIATVFLPLQAQAIPVSFEFGIPASQPGTTVETRLTITADNGGDSLIDQVFLNTDILAFSLTLDGTTHVLDQRVGGTVASTSGSQAYITTNDSGTALLDLSADANSSVSLSASPDASARLELLSLGTRVDVGQGPAEFGFVLDGSTYSNFNGADLIIEGDSRIVAEVAEPGVGALLALGVVALGFSNRRRCMSRSGKTS